MNEANEAEANEAEANEAEANEAEAKPRETSTVEGPQNTLLSRGLSQ